MLKSLINKNTAQGAVYSQFAPQIISGRDLRDQYAAQAGQSSEDVIRQEYHPAIAYVALRNGQVADYEPPIEAMASGQSDLNLARYPIYKALLESLSK